MDDSALYTGVDGEPDSGMFGNEVESEEVTKLKQEQKQQLESLRPNLEKLLAIIDSERDLTISFITEYIDSTKDSDDLVRAELKAAARYRKYLEGLKTNFTLALQETKKK